MLPHSKLPLLQAQSMVPDDGENCHDAQNFTSLMETHPDEIPRSHLKHMEEGICQASLQVLTYPLLAMEEGGGTQTNPWRISLLKMD